MNEEKKFLKEEKKMKNIINQDSLIIIGMILIVAVISMVSSYAYITWRGNSDGGLTTNIGDLATISFPDGVNISSTNLAPVLNYEDGISITYSIYKKIDTQVYIVSSISINEMADELKTNKLKYVLLKSIDQENYETIATGDFSNIEDDNLNILQDYELTETNSYYKLYIYLDGRLNNNDTINKKVDLMLNIGVNKEYEESLETEKIEEVPENTPEDNINEEETKDEE